MPKPKRFRTPEEEKRAQEGQEYLRQREKRTEALLHPELTEKEARAQASGEIRIQEEEKAKVQVEQQKRAVAGGIEQQYQKMQPAQQLTQQPAPEQPKLPLGIAQQDTIRTLIEATGGNIQEYDKVKSAITTGAAVVGVAALGAYALPAITASVGTTAASVGAAKLSLGSLFTGALAIGGIGKLTSLPAKVTSNSEQVLTDSRRSADALIRAAKEGFISVDDALVQLSLIEANIAQAERNMKFVDRFDLKNFIGAGGDVEAKILRIKEEMRLRRQLLFQALAGMNVQVPAEEAAAQK